MRRPPMASAGAMPSEHGAHGARRLGPVDALADGLDRPGARTPCPRGASSTPAGWRRARRCTATSPAAHRPGRAVAPSQVGDARRRSGSGRRGRSAASRWPGRGRRRAARRRWWGSARRSARGRWRRASTWSVSCSMSLAVMARATTSRGGSSSTKRSPSRSRISAPWPRSASDRSGRGMRGLNSAVGWNCMNSTSAHGTPARSAMARPSPVDTQRGWWWRRRAARRRRWPAGRGGPGSRGRSPSSSRATTPRQRPSLDEQVEGEPPLPDGGRRGPHLVDEGPLDLGAGGGAAGVHDAGQRVAALAGQQQLALAVAVEHGAHGDELVDARRALVDQDPHGVDVAQAGAGGRACRPGAGRWSRGRRRARRPRRPGPSGWRPGPARPW